MRVKMGSNDFITLFFLVAAVLIFLQLRSVLGRRTGSEKPPFDPYSPRDVAKNPGGDDSKGKSGSNAKASNAEVMSLAVGSTKAAPMATSPNPTVDAFVSACMRVSASGKRSTPTAASSVRSAPQNMIVWPITRRALR